MKVFYDLEFFEGGSTIQLISIGMVAEDGREYYAVDRNGPWKLVQRDPWLMANVWPTLPLSAPVPPYPARLNLADPAMRTLDQIRIDVRDFLLGPGLPDPGPVELWAYCGAYDHVRLCQMWGRAVNKPAVVPWWTNDLAQEAQRLGVDLEQLVPRDGGQHNALADARWNRDVHAALWSIARDAGPLRCVDCGHQADEHGDDGCAYEITSAGVHGAVCQCRVNAVTFGTRPADLRPFVDAANAAVRDMAAYADIPADLVPGLSDPGVLDRPPAKRTKPTRTRTRR